MSYASNERIGMTPPHPFDNAIHLDTIDGNVRRGRTHPEWANMVRSEEHTSELQSQ